jgi:hypothetical protein
VHSPKCTGSRTRFWEIWTCSKYFFERKNLEKHNFKLPWSFQFISILFLTSIKIKRDYTRIYVHLQKSSWRLDQAQSGWIIQGFNECCRLWWSFSGLRWSMAKRIYTKD